MKRFPIFLMFVLCVVNSFGQNVYFISDFSDLYFAKVTLPDNQDGVFKEGRVILYSKKDDSELFRTNSESIDFDEGILNDSIIKYNEQGVIVFTDFNFDGQNDFAIQQDYSSKGPVYFVYLFSNNSFQLDEEFTSIIQESQGNYVLDPEARTIQLTSCGGCCWHSFSTYIVRDGKPYPLKKEIRESDLPFNITTTEEWINGQMTETVEKWIDLNQQGVYLIMSFDLLNKNKKVVLYNINNRTLNYALIDKNNKVEFNFPLELIYKNPDFIWASSKNELSFKNKDAYYKIYQIEKGNKVESLGIKVTINGKEYDMKGNPKTLSGNLKRITILDNVVKK